MLKNPRVRTEADNLFGCYGTSVSTYKGVWRSHARGFERNSAYQPSRFENHATLFMHKAMPSEKKVSDGIGVEARTTRACVPHTPYAWVLDFMQATACYDTDVKKSQGAYRGR